MKALTSLVLIIMVGACAPLYPHNTLGEDIGEVAIRIVACPITLCMSELGLHERRRQQAQEEAQALAYQKQQQRYQQWYQTLTPEEQAREDYNQMELAERERDRAALRQSSAMQALGMMNMGRPLLQYMPPPRIIAPNTAMPMYQPPTRRCTSFVNGQIINTTCN